MAAAVHEGHRCRRVDRDRRWDDGCGRTKEARDKGQKWGPLARIRHSAAGIHQMIETSLRSSLRNWRAPLTNDGGRRGGKARPSASARSVLKLARVMQDDEDGESDGGDDTKTALAYMEQGLAPPSSSLTRPPSSLTRSEGPSGAPYLLPSFLPSSFSFYGDCTRWQIGKSGITRRNESGEGGHGAAAGGGGARNV